VKDRVGREADIADAKAVWDKLSRHVTRGEEAIKLLEQVFIDIGPYRSESVKDKTWQQVCRFFDFDDNE
jgi:hypothetical protein